MTFKEKIILKTVYLLAFSLIVAGILFFVDRYGTQYQNWEMHNTIVNEQNTEKQVISWWYNRFAPNTSKEIYPIYKTKLKSWEKEKEWLDLNKKMVKIDESKVRILILGDSFVWGDGYENSADLWWKKLNVELRDRGYDNIDIYAAGQCGSSTEDQLFWITKTNMIEEIKPDMIIIGYVYNDAQRYTIEYKNGEYAGRYFRVAINNEKLFNCKRMAQVFPNVGYLLENMINNKINTYRNFDDTTGYPGSIWPAKTVEGKELEDYDYEVVDPLGEFCVGGGIPTIAVTLPVGNYLDMQKEIYDAVMPLFEKAGIGFYNLYDKNFEELLETYSNDDLMINPVNTHPGRRLTTYYAECVADILERDFSDIVGEPDLKQQSNEIIIDEGRPWSIYPVMDEDNIVQISYPAADGEYKEQLQFMPVDEPYIRISFQYPVGLSGIKLLGLDNLNGARVWVTAVSEDKGFDDGTMYQLIQQDDGIWKIENDRVTSICIHLDDVGSEAIDFQMALMQ